MGCRLRVATVLILGSMAAPLGSPAVAMQFQRVPIEGAGDVYSGTGPIVEGDTDRFRAAVAAAPPSNTVLGISLDSPGGNVFEAEKFAQLIHGTHAPVFVFGNAKCVSACFLLFAAAGKRLVAPEALIGVHSVSESGQETAQSMGLTTAMARDLAVYGVPPAIIGKAVSTRTERVEWLTAADLNSMDVILLNPTPTQQSVRAPPTPPQQPPAQVALAQPPPAPPAAQTAVVPTATSQAFRDGFAERSRYEAWFNGLPAGDYRDGAEWWATNRSYPPPGGCRQPAFVGRAGVLAGCAAAQAMLMPMDWRRRHEADYKAGWNSIP